MEWKTLVAEIERTATRRGRSTSGACSVEGLRLVERALRAGAKVHAVLLAESLAAGNSARVRSLLSDLDRRGCPVVAAPDAELDRITGGRDSGPIVGLVETPESVSLDSVASDEGPLRLLVTVDVDDPGNLGALARTALVGGARALVVTGRGDPFHPRSLRISRGSLFRIPVVRIADTRALLPALRDHGIVSLAAVSRGGECLPTFEPPHDGRWAVCLGSESGGLPAELVERVDHRVSIPMADDVDSYSVHGAAAILLYTLGSRAGAGT